jgi:hypothetical protein
MSCCGEKRAALGYPSNPTGAGAPRYQVAGSVEFEYIGQGELTVTGPLTGIIYSFSADRRRQRVEGQDAPSLVYVPSLKAIR